MSGRIPEHYAVMEMKIEAMQVMMEMMMDLMASDPNK